jgi:hypothetical protein
MNILPSRGDVGVSTGSLECERVDSSEAQIRERCVTSAVDTSVPGQVQQLSHTLLLLNQRVGRNRTYTILPREDAISLGFRHPRREDLPRTSGYRETALTELGLPVPNPHVAVVTHSSALPRR